jgi:putative transposase
VVVHVPTIKRLARIVYVALASIILLEVGLRILSLFPGDTPYYTSDPSVGFRVRPNASAGKNKTNSSGFNDVERKRDKKTKDDIRILVIGDSFVFGAVPRNDNFVSVIERLTTRAIPNIEIWNMGIPAAGPENYLNLIREDAVSAGADLACVVFFHGVSEATVYAWRKRFGALEAVDVRRLRGLEQENAKLKKLLAERDLEIEVMREVAAKKW